MKALILAFCVFVTSAFGQGSAVTVSNCPTIPGKNSVKCQSPNFPHNYENGNCHCGFSVEKGYYIEATVEYLKLDSSKQDYLLIKSEKGDLEYRFSWFLNDPKSIIILDESVDATFVANQNSSYEDDRAGFTVVFKRYGEVATTVEQTTEISWPTPAINQSIYYTVYLNIKAPQFRDKQKQFREIMVDSSEEFCDSNNISLAENITVANVDIQLAIKCSVQWPDSKHCVKVRFAIPLFLQNSKYELSAENLEKMWNEIAKDKLKALLNWPEYEVPDKNYTLMIWLTGSLVILVLFLGFLFFIKGISFRLNTHIDRRFSDTEHIIATPKKTSDASLWPTSNQVVPPLFDNETAYAFYEPDMFSGSAQMSQMHNSASANIMQPDDLSDDEILNIQNVMPKNTYQQSHITLTDDSHAKESAL